MIVGEVGHVVVTWNEAGEIVAVTRQDDEGRILSVIAERGKPPAHSKSEYKRRVAQGDPNVTPPETE